MAFLSGESSHVCQAWDFRGAVPQGDACARVLSWLASLLTLAALPRSQLANLLKEHCLVAGGDTNVSQWLKDESSDASLSSILKARSACLTQYPLC